MKKWLQYKWIGFLAIVLSALGYVIASRFVPRSDFYTLIGLWVCIFSCSFLIINNKKTTINQLLFVGVFFRVLVIDVLPWMSQDYFRFIWDGRLLIKGINPYLSTPLQHISANNFLVNQAQLLYEGMGALNAKHYTNYPPMSQLGYFIAAILGQNSIITSVIVMRVILILSDIGTFIFGVKLLKELKLPQKNIAYYFLNPFIIIELIGNLHFEALMVFFLVASLFCLIRKKWVIAGILLGISVNVKLLPLILIPIFARFFLSKPLNSFYSLSKFIKSEKKNTINYIVFILITIGINMLFFVPFTNAKLIENYTNSVGLWFSNFEFNASLYYIARWIGYQITGWNVIAITGKLLPAFAILIILCIGLFRKNENPRKLLVSLLFGFFAYLVCSTTIHPWYLAIPLVLSCFTHYRFLWVWSCVVVLSYHTYQNPEHWKENLWWVALEYAIVFLALTYELLQKKVRIFRKY